MSETPQAGEVFKVRYPFVRQPYTYLDDEGPVEADGWKPGTRFKHTGDGDVESLADGRGEMRLTVVHVFKPAAKYQTRVCFTRRFVTPDGKEFGKGKLHIVTAAKFKRLSTGYQHEYRLPSEPTRESVEARFYREISEFEPAPRPAGKDAAP